MDIQWFPGHMAKARRLMRESLPLIDVVIELLDARIPLSSKNPEIDELAGSKKRLTILNKSDMADTAKNIKWEKYFRELGHEVILANSISGEGISGVYGKSALLMREKLESMAKKGRKNVTIRAMVVGIPNVGKSAFINKSLGRKGAAVENRPGVTKANQWLKVSKNFELLDTPGILWPKFEDKDAAVRLALTGAIKDELLDKYELCIFLLSMLETLYPSVLNGRYGVDTGGLSSENTLAAIAEKRGFRLKGGELDIMRACTALLDDFRKCRLGRLTLETPNDYSSCKI